LNDTIVAVTTDGRKLEYEIVGIVEDEEQNGYAVGYSEVIDEFIVTDEMGTLLADDELAQEILDDFRVFSEEAAPAEEPEN
jgi:hypothetical protein